MDRILFKNLDTREIQLLLDLSTLERSFLLNEAFASFNHQGMSKLTFYMLFFGLQLLRLVSVEHLPQEMYNGMTNIKYRLTAQGKEVVQEYKKIFMQ